MSETQATQFLIIGGGPTGLGAACRFQEAGRDWHLLETEGHMGGLASSFVDEKGFTWDLGGHVLFSHYESFDRLMDRVIPSDGWLFHQRKTWVWIRDRFVPYPFQHNLHRLPPDDRWTCVKGLLDLTSPASGPRPTNFGEWMLATMGRGITDIFLRPYNQKVWALPPEKMDYAWVGERVAVPRLEQVLKSICTGQDEVSWGPNNLFQFPKHGGTGSIWNAVGALLPANRLSLCSPVTHIDLAHRTATTADGRTWFYESLITTMPLDQLLAIAPGAGDPAIARQLLYSSTHVIGVGIEGQPPEHLRAKTWMYFPASNSPYYRVTVFSNYSPHNVPEPGRQWSLMAEVSESTEKPVDTRTLLDETLRAMGEDRLLLPSDRIISLTTRRIPQGYPTPFLGRNQIIDPILRSLESHGVYSRGRFGAWKYEVSNQDHCYAQGSECASRLIAGGGPELEPTLFTPDLVNSRKNS
jgi:protoporphyrinogen oxidase